jgi:hypothetical protein
MHNSQCTIFEYAKEQLLERLEMEPLKDTQDKRSLFDDNILAYENDRFDVIISNISLPFIKDIKGNLGRIYNLLEKDGVFLAAVIDFNIDMREVGNILYQTGFKVSVVELEKVTVLNEEFDVLYLHGVK